MKKIFAFAALLCLAGFASAQSQVCTCPPGGPVASDPFPPTAAPVSCEYTLDGNVYDTKPVVLSSTIPTSNAGVCFPPDPTYNPGVAGSVACSVPMTMPNGAHTITAVAIYAGGVRSVPSAPFALTCVATLSPPAPAKLRRQ